ncbi:ABC transporter permease [Actinomadura rugatobispora]|uniref:ABC transporter permease n=1 Tax=Actinomadura rugatobispora TaxID=1994 RepID=A0ABW1ACW0_9ACTN|nr:ABC transporter permease [Actinomadura rugatobispora]
MSTSMPGGGTAAATPDRQEPGNPGQRWIEIRPGAAEQNPRRHQRRRRLLERGLAVLVPVALIAAWQIAGSTGLIESRYFPPPSDIVAEWQRMFESGLYIASLKASLQRIVLGYALGAGAGLLLAFAIAPSRLLRSGLEPVIVALYTVPKLSILPLLLLIFGIGETSKVLLVALTCFFVVLLNTIDAVAGVSPRYLDVGRASRASRLATLRHITAPAALPQMLTGLRLSAGLAVIVIVGAEFVAAKEGLGYLVWNAWNIAIPERMYVGIVTISAVGVIANMLIRLAERVLTPWARRSGI